MKRDPEGLAEQLNQVAAKGRPPVHEWNPPYSGEMDLRIAAGGRWFYQGTPIARKSLVKLFASVLRREGEDYFLVTPVEKWRIQVEDVPFQVLTMEVEGSGSEQRLIFTTDMDESVVADEQHPLWVETTADEQPRPYLHVRDGMDGLIARSVFYRLVELARVSHHERDPVLIVSSGGRDFVIGALEEEDPGRG